jgi:hypothetical protein
LENILWSIGNVSFNEPVFQNIFGEKDIIKRILNYILSFLVDSFKDKPKGQIFGSLICCLSNLLHKNSNNIRQFLKSNGVKTLLKLLESNYCDIVLCFFILSCFFSCSCLVETLPTLKSEKVFNFCLRVSNTLCSLGDNYSQNQSKVNLERMKLALNRSYIFHVICDKLKSCCIPNPFDVYFTFFQ